MAVVTVRHRLSVPGARLMRWWAGLGTWRKVGIGVFAAQFLAMAAFSQVQASRGALTHDFAIYWQAVYLIAHGHLNPYSTIGAFPYLDNHFELIMWPIAFLWWLWPHADYLLWIQDAATVGASLVGFLWALDVLRDRDIRGRLAWIAPLAALALLAANPWPLWGAAFDYHNEALSGFFIVLAAWMLYRGRVRASVVWVALTLLCGDVSATYVVALGATAALVSPHLRRTGAAYIAVGLAWLVLIELLGAGKGSALGSTYAYLAGQHVATPTLREIAVGTVTHPARALANLWSNRVSIYANLAPGGFLGLLSPWSAALTAVVLLESELAHYVLFGQPGMQNVPIYAFVGLGTVWWIARLWARSPRFGAALASALGASAVAWGVVWVPRIPAQWAPVAPGTMTAARSALRSLPRTASVIASQGIVGTVANRPTVYAMMGGSSFSAPTGPTVVLVAPYQGVELAPPSQELARIDYLASAPGWTLLSRKGGVWVFERASGGPVRLPSSDTTVPAWALRTADGTPVIGGPISTWYMAGGETPGYVVDGAYWREPPGVYRVAVKLAASGPVNVEVWNATGSALLRRWKVGPTKGVVTVGGTFSSTRVYPHNTFSGIGPFSDSPIPPPTGDNLEVRVWSPGGEVVSVYSVSLIKP